MNLLRKIISLIVSVILAVILFTYLAETDVQWRILLSGILFISTYITLDGFLQYI